MSLSEKSTVLGINLVDENLVIVPNAPPRYTIDDWNFDNRQKNRISEDQQILGNRILHESERLIDETRSITEDFKKEVDFRLKERLESVEFLVNELQVQKKKASIEEEGLKAYRQRILYAIDNVKEKAMKICQKCIILRENRLGVDMVNDDVDQELKRELTVISGCQQLLNKTLEETTEQIRRIRASIYLLDRDLSNKQKSIRIDNTNLILRENQMGMSVYEGTKPLNPYTSTNTEWEELTNKNIQNAAMELNSATPLRSYVDILLKQVVEDLMNQVNRTNEAFFKRISETRYVKNRLEVIHNETAKQVNNMTRNITKIEIELAEMQGYLALCQMRLANRAQRPGIELCKDVAHDTLMNELATLRETVGKLNQMLVESKASMRYLLQTQIQQEEEINIKTNTLKIDEVDCVTIRQGISFQSF